MSTPSGSPALAEGRAALDRGDPAAAARSLEAARADAFFRRDRDALQQVLEAATRLDESARSADRKLRQQAERLVANTRYSLQNLVDAPAGQWYPATAPAAAAPGRPVVAPAALDPIDQIRRLAELRNAGVLSEEEFQAKKAELLARL